MLEKEILKLLTKISLQLECISKTQDSIRQEIHQLQGELDDFQEVTLRNIEEKLAQSHMGIVLN